MSRVAIQGEEGSFSHAAARQVFGPGVEVVVCQGFDELFAAVAEGGAEAGAVPVENTLAGAVVENLDLLVRHDLHVTGETRVRVELCLVARPGRTVTDLSTVASHPVALRQCRGLFARHPWLKPVPAWDTAGSVRDLLTGEAAYDGAIGSTLAAEIFGGSVLERGVEDDAENHTRFFIVGRRPGPRPEGPARAALIFTLAHRPGSLHGALACFAERGVDLCRLESRPIPGRPWEYRFHLDATAADIDALDAAVEELGALAPELRVLGRYPSGA